MNAAKETFLLNDSSITDAKKLFKLRQDLDKMVFSDIKGKDKSKKVELDPNDYQTYFMNLDKKFNNLKEEEEEKIINMFEEATTYDKD